MPLIDIFLFVCDQVDSGLVQLDEEQTADLHDAQAQMLAAKAQLQGTDYSRTLLYLTLPVSGDETYSFIDTIRETAQKYIRTETSMSRATPRTNMTLKSRLYATIRSSASSTF